ncbi:hypothetical protein N7468_000889 [Penicillium chermesinum]|uniref:Uncharacterized protein n=1 Tax=Penicillium chermesinum TaxID=63820 RepID=A0A9W9PHB2_9EURO|nr:uncharacterized protein N7468_000889 [Penicillium chermesinum]KAJ5245906.1 hypothetical protein N7468_000889 [Penicillium chermesinum]
MTSSNSPEAVADPASSSAAAPYGTRSRGRNAPRPNYAEDRDIDMEIETPAKAAKRTSGMGLNHVNGSKSEDSEKSSPTLSRKSLTNGAAANASPKESIPGTSSFSARPDENGSGSLKKRKHPGGPNGSGYPTKKIFTGTPGDSEDGYFTNMVSFEASQPFLQDGQLVADDGTTFAVNGVIEALRVNWYYRPRDIQRHSPDSRFLYASMHSDTCPLSSLRGKCQIRHVTEIEDMNTYKKTRDSFWYDKMFDRYIHRLYDVIPTKDVINVPTNVKKVLDDRWKFILVEVGKGKELTGAVKTCKRCRLFAANSESVDCAVCHSTYHMHCVRPALTKKPARGFAWACAACSRAQERKLEARNTPMIGENRDGEDEIMEDEEDENHANGVANETSASTPAATEEFMPKPATAEQTAQAKMWPYRYLGIHCRVEDALDYDDRIYPRASSRLGPRHQANVSPWPGRPVEYVKLPELKKKMQRVAGGRSVMKYTKESQAAIDASKQERATRPKWVQDEPPGYIERGLDEPVLINGKQAHTSELLFKMPTPEQIPCPGEDDATGGHPSGADPEAFIDEYMRQAKELAPHVGVEKYSTNFLDKALELLYSESFDVQAALAKLKKVNKYKDLKEPNLRPEEVKLFEQAVSKYGSEWRNITKHVKTVPHYQIVRFYYMWKKTPRGRQVWGAYAGRRGKKESRRQSIANAKLLDDVADDYDDSAFDNDKAAAQKRGFQCKFCSTRSSRQWRRAPGVAAGFAVPSDPSAKKDKGPMLMVALCLRCALLWRKYSIQYEDVDDGHKSWRRRIDEELLAQLILATETPFTINSTTAATAASMGISVDSNPQLQHESKLDPTKKKIRTDAPSTSTATSTAPSSVEPMPKKKTAADKPVDTAPIVPDPPKAKILPCAVCNKVEPVADEHLSCRDCRLTIHRNCYGVRGNRAGKKWLCDMCLNDRSPSISTTYECVLCPVTWTEHDLMETTKNNSKKKSDRDKEKERMEKDMLTEATKLYRSRQETAGKPVGPREPLKRTAGNNWSHVLCSLWTPEIKFGEAAELEPAEGFGSIPKDRWRETCKICKSSRGGLTISASSLYQSRALAKTVRPLCASALTKVQRRRWSSVPTTPCPPNIHEIGELTNEDGLNALQLFAQTYKQADKTLTGTSRKAAYMQQSVAPPQQHAITAANRRASTSNGLLTSKEIKQQQTPVDDADEMDIDTEDPPAPKPMPSGPTSSRKCVRCATDISPRWWPSTRRADPRGPLVNGVAYPGSHPYAQPPLAQNTLHHANGDVGEQVYECHKCHLKYPPPPEPAPEPRTTVFPAPATAAIPAPAQRPVLPTPRMGSHSFVTPGPPPPPQAPGVLGRPMAPAHSHTAPPGYPGFEQRIPSAESSLRNGMSPPCLSECRPSTCSSYGKLPSQSPWPTSTTLRPTPSATTIAAPPPRPAYVASASPPIVQATVNRSPQASLSALNGGPPSRMYAVESNRMGAPSHSPPVAQTRIDPRASTPTHRPDETPPSHLGGPPSAGRHPGMNGASASSGASASPS